VSKASDAPKKPKSKPGRKPQDLSFKLPAFPPESRSVQALLAPPGFRSLYHLQDEINKYFTIYLTAAQCYPSPASLSKFLNFSSVNELKAYRGTGNAKSGNSAKRLIDKAILRIEEILCHLVSSKQSFGGPIFLLKSQCGYSETDILRLEAGPPAVKPEELSDLRAVVQEYQKRKRARLLGEVESAPVLQ
jgi:hypothetical protein